MTELKNCPFCKAEPISENNRRFFLKHNPDCFLAHPMHNANCNLVSSGSIADHIKAWNTRPAEDALTAEIERLKRELKLADSAAELTCLKLESEVKKLKAALKDMCELWESMGKQIPLLLNEQKYLNAKAIVGQDTNVPANSPDTGKMEEK